MSSIKLKQRTGSIKVKQRSGSIKLKERTGSIELTNRKIIHKNYFGPDKVGYIEPDTELLRDYDGYDTVYKVDANERTGYVDFITNGFIRSNFADYAGDGKYLHLEFWAKWDDVIHNPRFNYVKSPPPDPEKYQHYIAESDGSYDGNYFRLYYYPDQNAVAFITNVKVYKVSPPEYVFA